MPAETRSRVRAHEKRTLQKVTERLYFTYLRGIPHSTNLNYNWIGFPDVINLTRFGNDRYKVTEVEFWLMACCL